MDISNTLTWEKNFGLLPIHLSPHSSDINNFILLNGGSGDFCFSTDFTDLNPEIYNSKAWSSNSKNFIALDNNHVHLYNWKKGEIEKINKRDIVNNFGKFYQYLIKNSYKSSSDVVPFLIELFKQLRQYTQESNNAVEALNLLFSLLTTLEDENVHEHAIQTKWALNSLNLPSNFSTYIEKLHQGTCDTKPILDLILRHTSGILFQEAQKEALSFSVQRNLFGDYADNLQTKKLLYSSIHYTPPYLSRTIVENTIKKLDLSSPSLKIIDPACGSGEFLIEALKQLKEKKYEGIVSIHGWDSSASAVHTTKFLLNYEKRTIWSDKLIFDIKQVNDSLSEDWETNYDLILMNPPFMSWEQMDKNSRDIVKNSFDSFQLKSTKPNQASAFFYKAINSLNSNGVIGCVIPSSLLTLDAYKQLRDNTKELINIDFIGKLGNFIFEDALTDVSIILGHKPKENINPYIMWVKNEKDAAKEALRELRKMQNDNSLIVDELKFSIYQAESFPVTRENWKPISFNENKMVKSFTRLLASNSLIPISEIFSVKQGIRTGKNDLLKISLEEYNKIPNEETSYFRPTIDNESIDNGRINIKNYVWYPYDENGLNIINEEELKEKAPFFYENVLEKNKNSLQSRAGINSEQWWCLTRHREWLQKHEQRLISTEFGNSNSFAFDIDGKYAIERGNAWIPKKEFERDNYYFYLAFFSSDFFNKLLSIYSKQLAGANSYDLGKKYTSDIPIPNINNSFILRTEEYRTIVNIGKEIIKDKLYSSITLDEVIESHFYKLA